MARDSLWQPAYIALGSNLQQPVAQVRHALRELERLPDSRMIFSSALYRSAPMGPQDQPDFINAVAAILTQLSPEALLDRMLDTERHMGRVRTERWGPRIIDLDLLLLGDERRNDGTLQLPHPGMAERAFVLVPLAEIAPGLRLPDGRTAAQAAARCVAPGLERLP